MIYTREEAEAWKAHDAVVSRLDETLEALRVAREEAAAEKARADKAEARAEWFRAAHMLMAQEHILLPVAPDGSPFVYSKAEAAVVDGEPRLCVIVNDTFAYASADAEDADYADAPELLRLAVAEGWPGLVRWVQARRHQKGEPAEPLPRVQETMLQVDGMRHDLKRLRDREEFFRAHLRLPDDGRYRNDWPGSWETALRELEALREAVRGLGGTPTAAQVNRLCDEGGKVLVARWVGGGAERDYTIAWAAIYRHDALRAIADPAYRVVRWYALDAEDNLRRWPDGDPAPPP